MKGGPLEYRLACPGRGKNRFLGKGRGSMVFGQYLTPAMMTCTSRCHPYGMYFVDFLLDMMIFILIKI
jgi:hypothetical protein